MRRIYATDDAAEASRLARSLGIGYLYLDSTERREFGESLGKFDGHPELLERVYQGGEASIYRVIPDGRVN